MANKLHYTFTGTLASKLTDPCIMNMAISGILVNETTREMYVRTKISSPININDWTLLNSGTQVLDRYVASGTLVTATKVLQLTRSDGVIVNVDLSALTVTPSNNLSFNNSGTNFISTTVENAIKELNTSRPFGKVGVAQNQTTTNKQVLINDDIYHLGKLQVGSNVGVTSDMAMLRVNGAFASGENNILPTSATKYSFTVGGKNNIISDAIDNSGQFEGNPLSGSGFIGGANNIISGFRVLSEYDYNLSIVGNRHHLVMNDNLTVIGNGHFIEHSFNGQVDGSNNTIFNSSNFEITGSNNVLFKGTNINTFTNSNNNVFLTLSQPTLVDSANNNIVLKQVGGTLRGDHNLVWGEGFRIQVSGVAAGNNIVLGRNVALVTSNNTFVWSASEAGVDPNDDPEISDDGCFVLLDASPQDYFQTAADNEFVARFSGGFRLRTNAAGTVGVDLAANGSSWASVSSILTKDVIFDNISVDNLVDKFKNISFKVYKYKDDELNTQFLSTSAEEWHTLMDGITTPEFMVTRQGVLPGIRINDQINLALLLIQDIYSRLDTLHVE